MEDTTGLVQVTLVYGGKEVLPRYGWEGDGSDKHTELGSIIYDAEQARYLVLVRSWVQISTCKLFASHLTR